MPITETTRSATGGSSRLTGAMPMRYPSPYLDIGSTYFPRTIRELLELCRVFYWIHPIISATVSKLARYPVTDVVFQHSESEEVAKLWSELVRDRLHFRSFLISIHLDYLAFGNAFASVIYPFKRFLICGSCREPTESKTHQDCWEYIDAKFILTCPKCGRRGPVEPVDQPVRTASGIKLHLWDPMDITIEDGEFPGTTRYLYRIPQRLANAVRMGKKEVVSSVPLSFLEAVHKSQMVLMNPSNFFHMRRQVVTGKYRGWGMPLLAGVLKYAFYLQIMMKAQETILSELLIPLRILFPQPASPTGDPFSTAWMTTWTKKLESEIQHWRQDPCVGPDTLLYTERGLTRADDIRVGDAVLDHLGGRSEVTAVQRRILRRGERAYRIVARGLTAIDSVFSEGHPIFAARSFNNGNGHKLGRPEFIKVKDLKPRDYVGFPVRRTVKDRTHLDLGEYVDKACTPSWVYVDHFRLAVPQAFEHFESCAQGKRGDLLLQHGWSLNDYKAAEQASRAKRTLRRIARRLPFDEETAWVVGLYLAEGSTSTKQVQFGLHRKEQDKVRRLRRFFKRHFCATMCVTKKGTNGIQVVFSSLLAAQFFANLCPGTARTKQIPKLYMEAEDRVVLTLLSGLFGGDGCFYSRCKAPKVAYGSSSINMTEQVRRLLFSLGIPASVVRIPGGPNEGLSRLNGKPVVVGDHYRVTVFGGHRYLRRLLGQHGGGEMGRSNMGVLRDGYMWHRITRVEEVDPSGVPFVVDLRTDPSHTFCTWGVATHNCYIPLLPLPVGAQTIGGEGRSLLMNAEIRMLLELIIASMEVPQEFVFSGTSYSASMVSLRQLENLCLGMVEDDRDLLRWLVDQLAGYMRWRKPESFHFKPFKMADDLTRRQAYLALWDRGLVSGHVVCSMNDLEYNTELEMRKREVDLEREVQEARAKASATVQGEAMLINAQYAVRAQAAQAQQAKKHQQGAMSGTTPPGGIGGPQETEQPSPSFEDVVGTSGLGVQQQEPGVHVPAEAIARHLVGQLEGMSPDERQMQLGQLRLKAPHLHGLVMEHMAMPARQLPEQRPPRSESAGL